MIALAKDDNEGKEQRNSFQDFINKIKNGFCSVSTSTDGASSSKAVDDDDDNNNEDEVLETMKNRDIFIAEPPLGTIVTADEATIMMIEKDNHHDDVVVDSKQEKVKPFDWETSLSVLLLILLSLLTMYQHGYRLTSTTSTANMYQATVGPSSSVKMNEKASSAITPEITWNEASTRTKVRMDDNQEL